MNAIEAYYGKMIEPRLKTILNEIQDEYRLTVPQVVGLLTIHDFFARITIYETHVNNLRIREGRDGELKHLPKKTILFFMGSAKCSDMSHFFCQVNTAKYFKSFAKKILNDIKVVADYVSLGLLEKVEAKKPITTVFNYVGESA
ncbi:MAG: hypothetical protein AB7D43_03080 [Sulfurimonadaceae bacterium]